MQEVETKRVSDYVKNVFVGVILACIWMHFLIRLIVRWNFLKPDIREAVSIFMALYCAMCLNIAHENRTRAYFSLSLALVVLLFVYRIVWTLT